MKRVAVVLIASFIATLALASYNPFSDGALASVKVMVVDDNGDAVEGAKVSLVFHVAPSDVVVAEGLTDKSGSFAAERNCTGEMRIWVRKDGYYDTKSQPTEFRTNSGMEASKTHRWSAKTVDLLIVLKKRRNPVRLVHKGGTYSDIKYPMLLGPKGFDLVLFDWCPPYGKGRYADIQISREYWRSKDDWLKVYDKTIVTMTNCLDGAYFANVDAFSSMRYPYEADTNEVFRKEFIFEYDRRTGIVVKNVVMPKGKCLVFRTRTKVDDEGRVKEANYGIITETFDPFADLDLEVFFNPTDNDTNLEAAQ